MSATLAAHMTTLPRALRDGFLGGYLPYLVMLHFDTLDLLLGTRELPSVEARLKALPLRGPETVSRILGIESVLASQGVKPPARPSNGKECGAWAQGIDGFLHRLEARTAAGEIRLQRDDAFALPRRAGAIVGDLEHALSLSLLAFELLREQPDHPFLGRQRDALLDGLRAKTRAKGAMTGVDAGSPLARGITHAVWLADEGARFASPETTFEAIAATLRHVRYAARAIDRSYAERGPSDAIGARARGEIDEGALHRALLEHPSWSTATQRPIEGGTYFVTTSPATFAPWASATGRGAAATELGSGWQWALGAPAEVQRVVINPMSTTELAMEGAAWSAFRERALEARIASAWRDWSQVDLGFLRNAPHAAILGPDGGATPVPWSDELGRPFAAMFTSEASLRRALEVGKRVMPEGARIGRATAQQIAARLLTANAPGVVVDPDSLERPRTFGRGMLERLAAS